MKSIARQGAGESDGVTLDDLLAKETGGPPRFFSPLTDSASAAAAAVASTPDGIDPRPLMLYVPGLDGTGFAASSQFDSLSRYFNLVALNIPVNDRSSYAQLVDIVSDFLESQRVEYDQTYLVGESMGGLLSLGVAQSRPDLVDRLVLVNPASSYDKSPWVGLSQGVSERRPRRRRRAKRRCHVIFSPFNHTVLVLFFFINRFALTFVCFVLSTSQRRFPLPAAFLFLSRGFGGILRVARRRSSAPRASR